MFFSTIGKRIQTRFFHSPAQEDAQWDAVAVPGSISRKTQQCLSFASAYWASALITPRLLDLGESDSAFLLAVTSLITLSEPTPAQIKQFRETLEKMIVEEMQSVFAQSEDDFDKLPIRADIEHCSLKVDYEPYGPLERAARAAGLDRLNQRFPWKTTMNIERGAVHLRERKGDWQVIYPYNKKQVKGIVRSVEQYCNRVA